MDYFSTGKIAKDWSISVRTLRYYDEIQLVTPTYKDDYGKRFYTQLDLLRLQKVLLLKKANMSLEDIQKLIDETTVSSVLDIHLQTLKSSIDDIVQAQKYTQTLRNSVDLEGEIGWEQLLPLTLKESEDHTPLTKEWETSLPKLENDDGQIKKWMNIIKRIELCLKNGEAPSSDVAQLIASDVEIYSMEMFNGNQALSEQFWEARRSKEQSKSLNLYPIKQEVIEFLESALTYMNNKS
ncbi:MerR family transcriptional regulator [Cytobacillus sp. FSL R5-0569]|uniref:MerR family transcriptional regulator n=1 Tax=Cytobacillus TaxID=2675230 RepID=UPI002781F24E|nr:MerR family transcriptional regulator [Cytobacillus kochii]MDQ0185563.1 DNA-binding transcriptional MerR regulator [Cytobacillus kochii]